jgi:ABC-2 type transport system permease protein
VPIFDQGYQHWNGTLSSHAWRWLAITRHGVRVGGKNRFLRILLILSWLPAIGLVFFLCTWGLLERQSAAIAPLMPFLSFMNPQIIADPHHYRLEIWTICYDWFLVAELYLSMLVILLVGPNLISQDLRYNALPLYLSRPLRRIDYFLGKLGVIVYFLGRMIVLPCIIAYVLGLLFSLDWTIFRDTFRLLLAAVTYGLIISFSAGLLILALSSLSRNSRYVALFWLGIWFIGSITGTILQSVEREQRRQAIGLEVFNEQHPDEAISPNQPHHRIRRRDVASLDYFERIAAAENEAQKKDWRPLTSYTANLSRIGHQLLGTNRAWENVARILPAPERPMFLMNFTGPQYPWKWSAFILLGLFGFSAWILHTQVKSLDRLK